MKKKIWNVIEAGMVFGLIFVFVITNLLSPIDYILRDALYQIPRNVTNDIKIIAIDDRTLEELGPIGTWSRKVYADLIKQLNSNSETKPAVIAFDILFSGNVDESGDIAFAQSAEESGNVVVVSQLQYQEKYEIDETGKQYNPIQGIIYPYDELREVAECGYSNVAQDSDGVVRRFVATEQYQKQEQTMFAKVVYSEYCQAMGLEENILPTDKYGRTLINYSGKPGDYEHISLVDVLDGKIDSRAFKDSIVIVGAYAFGMQDNFKVPNGYSAQMFGVEIHANIVQSLMQSRFAIVGNPYIWGIILGLVGAILHLLFKRNRIVLSTIILLVAVVLELLAGVLLNDNGQCFSLFYLPLVVVMSYVYSVVIGYFLEKLKRQKMLNAFKKYVAPEVVEEISKKGDFQVKLGGENRDIAVLFVDIRGFTTMSEVLEPEQVVEILNRYLNLTTNAIFKNKGTLDKFVGDATMAVFNSPFDLEDYEYHAVCAAMDIVAGGVALEQELQEKYGRSVGFGVGVNCGPAVVGNIGCEFRMDFTAIGDTVNTAARLESNAKKGQVLISDTLYERLKDRISVEEVGEIPLKGKSNNIFVYAVTSVNT